MTTNRLQTYECRLRRSKVLRLADFGAERVANAAQVALVGHALLRGVPHEQVWLLFVDAKNAITGAIRIGEGGLHGCALRPMDVLRPAIIAAASGIVLIHNHPSGDPTPSLSDRQLTAQVFEACESVGLVLLDHVVVTTDPKCWHAMGAQGDG